MSRFANVHSDNYLNAYKSSAKITNYKERKLLPVFRLTTSRFRLLFLQPLLHLFFLLLQQF